MAEAKKCANPVCSCMAQDKFCSPQCEAAKGTTAIACQCGTLVAKEMPIASAFAMNRERLGRISLVRMELCHSRARRKGATSKPTRASLRSKA